MSATAIVNDPSDSPESPGIILSRFLGAKCIKDKYKYFRSFFSILECENALEFNKNPTKIKKSNDN